jgi:hypothetical protein
MDFSTFKNILAVNKPLHPLVQPIIDKRKKMMEIASRIRNEQNALAHLGMETKTLYVQRALKKLNPQTPHF